MKNIPLVEKYRPTDWSEVVGIPELETIKTLLDNPTEMPNLLFYGPAGTGKTSVAKIIISKLTPIDYIRINGSDTTGVDTIRNKVYTFMTSMSSEANKPKLIWIEEFDYMSQNAFAALRSMMEQYMGNARFICTCNYINKIPEPIQSRFTKFEFSGASDEDIAKRLTEIVDKEKINIVEEAIKVLSKKSRGDIRTAINLLQGNNVTDQPDLIDEAYNLIASKQWSKIRHDIPNKHPDYNLLLVELDEKFFTSDIEISKKAEINEIISHGQFEMSFSFDKDICFSAICSKIIKIL